MLERTERQVKVNPLKAMLSFNKVEEQAKEERVEKTETKEPAYKMGAVGTKEETKKKRNERSYKRWRGKADGVETKPMSYYITSAQEQAILLRTQREGGDKDKSACVRNALDLYLKEELAFIQNQKKEGAK